MNPFKKVFICKLLTVITSALLLVQIGCRSGSADSKIAARVNSSTLTYNELKDKMVWKSLSPQQKDKYIETWVNRELLFCEAKDLNLDKSPDLKWKIEQVKKEFLVNRLLEQTYAKKIKISEKEVESYYNKNRDLFKVTQNERKILHILTETRQNARQALQEIAAGRLFQEVVKKYSIGIFKDEGGNMGFIKKEDVINEISRTAFRLSENKVSNIIKTEHGYHIIKVIKIRKQGDIKNLNDVRTQIIQRLRISKEKSVYFDLLAQLQNKHKIYIDLSRQTANNNDS